MSDQAALSHVSDVWSNVLRVKVSVINKNVLDVVVCIFSFCEILVFYICVLHTCLEEN